MKVLFVGGPTSTSKAIDQLLKTQEEIRIDQVHIANKKDTGVSIISKLPKGFPVTEMDKRQLESEMSMGCRYRTGVSMFSNPTLSRYRELLITEGRSAKGSLSFFDDFLRNRRKCENNIIYKNTVLKRRKETISYRRNRKRKRIQKLKVSNNATNNIKLEKIL